MNYDIKADGMLLLNRNYCPCYCKTIFIALSALYQAPLARRVLEQRQHELGQTREPTQESR